jgi:LacI family transcriptional regulator
LKEFRDRGIPIVMLDRTFPGVDAREVMVANQHGAERAVRHLIDHGYRNIFCVGYDRQFNSISQRIVGYELVVRDAGLKPVLIIGDEVAGIGPEVLHRLRTVDLPAAIFSLNNVTTTHVLHTLKREGIRVPEEVAVIGFDDFELAPLLAVPLTAVRQPAYELGRIGARLLLDWIRSGIRGSDSLEGPIVLPTELIIRRSCGCQPTQRIGRETKPNLSRLSGDSVEVSTNSV